MAAAKRDKAWRSGRRTVATRPVQMTRHLVASEGTETEPRYFEGMRDALGAANGHKLSVVVKGRGLHTLDLFEWAQDCCRRASDTFDHAWLVFDKDDFPAVDFDEVERRCAGLGTSPTFYALWSNPCFELWPLLHLRYTTASMDAAVCQRALADVLAQELGSEYRKSMTGLFALLESRRAEAERNTERYCPGARDAGAGVAELLVGGEGSGSNRRNLGMNLAGPRFVIDLGHRPS